MIEPTAMNFTTVVALMESMADTMALLAERVVQLENTLQQLEKAMGCEPDG